MTTIHLQQIVRLVDLHGSMPEKQLVNRWHHDLEAFFQPAERALLNSHMGMEFGIEDLLTLEIKLKSARKHPSTFPPMLSMMRACPALSPWAQYAIQHHLPFHCGVKLTPKRLTRELFICPRNYTNLPEIEDTIFAEAIREVRPTRIGIDDCGNYSMHFKATDTAWVPVLLNELGLGSLPGTRILPWQHINFDGQELAAGKTLVEFVPLRLDVLTRLISHYPFPYFRYLIPRRQLDKGGTICRDPKTGRFSLYAQVTA